MIGSILKISVLTVLTLMLSSCAAAKGAPAYELSYDSMGETPVKRSKNVNGGERMVAYSVSLELLVKNADTARKSIREQIKSGKGYIVSETRNLVTARLPSKNMDNFLNNIRILGKKESENKTGTDITDQYRDNTIALNNFKAVRDRYLALLEKAEAVDEILSIEKELERVNLEIEKLEGRIKYAEQSVSYSIITVYFRERTKPGPVGWVFYGLYYGIKWLFVWD